MVWSPEGTPPIDGADAGQGDDQGGEDACPGCVCEPGEGRPCGVAIGACAAGVETCEGRRWGPCEGATGPQEEACDGADNDCNGVTDEGCACEPGQERGCGVDVGECRVGVQRCEAGLWGVCAGERGPAVEGCDGLDNDCNGTVDEGCAPEVCEGDLGSEIYARRIEPLVGGGQPTTCNQCHLSGAELSAFVQATPCQSMACLVSQGLADLDDPAASAILRQIRMARPDSVLITQEVIDAEYQGFLEWIEYSAACMAYTCEDFEDPCGGGQGAEPPGDVLTPLGRCTEEAVGEAFETLVYATRERCAGCHDPQGARFQQGTMFLDQRFTPGDSGSRRAAALRTMYNLIGAGDVTVGDPSQSLLLLKPLAEEAGGVPHAGGPKFAGTDDPSYRSGLQWLQMYAACYASGDMPGPPPTPYVGILSPVNGATRPRGEAVVFVGEAVDPQEGLLPGDRLRWTLDGQPAGSQRRFERRLEAGPHTVTLVGTDADANAVSVTHTFTVQ